MQCGVKGHKYKGSPQLSSSCMRATIEEGPPKSTRFRMSCSLQITFPAAGSHLWVLIVGTRWRSKSGVGLVNYALPSIIM